MGIEIKPLMGDSRFPQSLAVSIEGGREGGERDGKWFMYLKLCQ